MKICLDALIILYTVLTTDLTSSHPLQPGYFNFFTVLLDVVLGLYPPCGFPLVVMYVKVVV